MNATQAVTRCGVVTLATHSDCRRAKFTEVWAAPDGSIREDVLLPEARRVFDPAITASGDSLVMVATILERASPVVVLATRPACDRTR